MVSVLMHHPCADGGKDCQGEVDAGNLCAHHRADYGSTRYDVPAVTSEDIDDDE